ncbi:MAG: ArsR family transcriptional regulator [Candidatus Aenigmatarchaeota archaeon]
MEYFVKEEEDRQKIFRATELELRKLNVFGSELVLDIIKVLAKKPSCAMDIARELNQHEQKIYYHLRRLERAGVISKLKEEVRNGALTKIYHIQYPYLVVKLYEEASLDIEIKAKEANVLYPFIKKGELNAIIVVSSPDPHGRFGAHSSDGYAAIDLALFLGSFLKNSSLNYRLDTQIREEDMEKNLILIGGPKANIIVDKINKYLPIYFDEKNDWQVVSTLTDNIYKEDDIGILIKMRNPINIKNWIFFFGGKRFKGTRASTIALVKYSKKLEKGNKFKDGIARVVKGIDKDGDGIIDDVIFIE